MAVIFGLFPDWTIMVLTAFATFGIIGCGWWLLPEVVFPQNEAYLRDVGTMLTVLTLTSWLRGLASSSTTKAHLLRTSSGKKDDPVETTEDIICEKCAGIKPPRAHHCRVCATCVQGMDHHCYFLHTCIGDANQLHFIRYVLWVAASTSFVAVLSAVGMYFIGVDVPSVTESPKMLVQIAAFSLAIPVAMFPALLPFFGVSAGLRLTAAIMMNAIGVLIPFFALLRVWSGLNSGVAVVVCVAVHVVGCCLGSVVGLGYYCSLCAAVCAIFLFVLTVLISSDVNLVSLSLLFASAATFAAFTSFLLMTHLERVAVDVTYVEELKGKSTKDMTFQTKARNVLRAIAQSDSMWNGMKENSVIPLLGLVV